MRVFTKLRFKLAVKLNLVKKHNRQLVTSAILYRKRGDVNKYVIIHLSQFLGIMSSILLSHRKVTIVVHKVLFGF